MRKLVSALAISAGLVLLAIPAHAQDYPPTTDEGLTVSESTLSPGESFVVSGEGADPGATVVFTLTRTSSTLGSGARLVAAGPALARAVASVRPLAQGSTTLGSTTADSDGNFRATASTTGGLAFTGSNVGPGLAIGAGLIVAGGLLLLAVRRRRRSTV